MKYYNYYTVVGKWTISLLLVISFSLLVNVGAAQSLYTYDTEPKVTGQNTGVVVAPSLTVNTAAEGETSTTLTAATVSISSNFTSPEDILRIEGNTSGTDSETSINYSYDSTTGILTLTGTASEASYQTTLRKVTYVNTSASPSTLARTITFSLNSALPYSGNGHYYEFVTSAAITWENARTAAAGKSYFGLQGYLVTVTSQGENDFCAAKLNGQGWIGANDAAVEGVWKWETGPESGTQFWSGGSAANGGTLVGAYANWASGEPNNNNNDGDENYAHFLTGGTWNDMANTNTTEIAGYVVEYGGMSGETSPHISDYSTVNIAYDPTGVTSSAATVSSNSWVKLTAAGDMGTVYWYTGSCGGTQVTTGNPVYVLVTETTTYYARNYVNGIWSDGCKFSTVSVAEPSFSTPSFSVANLSATGTDIKWYDSEGTALSSETVLVDGTTYYASQTVNGVESTERTAVTVDIDDTPCAPTGDAEQTLSSGATVSDLSVTTGSNIRWYSTASGGTPLAPNVALSSGTYYATQTVDYTESATRLAVTVTIN